MQCLLLLLQVLHLKTKFHLFTGAIIILGRKWVHGSLNTSVQNILLFFMSNKQIALYFTLKTVRYDILAFSMGICFNPS